jgi:DNA helicase-2/ATP-dependent DNA helicase PcrA
MSEILAGLNEEQKEAVLNTEGPVLILAGAGSGKTKALTHRVAYLIKEKHIKPENILAVTFTNKAAKEMINRVYALIDRSRVENNRNWQFQSKNSPTMGTFHSICARILRDDIDKLGFKRSFNIYDENDSNSALKKAIKNLSMDDRKISVQTVKSYISSAKNELMGPEEYVGLANGYLQEFAAKVYPEYQKILKRNNALDFDDLLFYTVKLFQTESDVLDYYQTLWRYIHIDEYQDTNHVQYLFANLLAKKHHNLCVVGDDWQSIYSWRGANFRNILEFEKDYPKAKIIKLEQNYRSTKAILEAGHCVINKNVYRSEKKLWTENESGCPIVLYEAETEQSEAQFVIRESERLVIEEDYKLGEMAVLYRTNAQSRAVEAELVKFGVPYKIIGGVRFYERKEIKDILAYLRIISSDDDWVAFERIINVPTRGVGDTSIKKLVDFANHENLSISGSLEMVDEVGITPRVLASLKEFRDILSVLRQEASRQKLPEFIDKVIKKSGYEAFLNDDTVTGEERLENLKELLSVAKEFELTHEDGTLEAFLEEISLISDIDNWKQSNDALTLMTLHAAKGLEFRTVFLVGMEENIFPHANSLYDPEQLEEERRLCYVGITRAKERLYMTLARKRMLFGNISANSPSRFLDDISDHLTSDYKNILSGEEITVAEEKIGGFFKKGDLVLHEEFGEGVILEVDDDEVLVDFDGLGEKWLSLTFANLKRK